MARHIVLMYQPNKSDPESSIDQPVFGNIEDLGMAHACDLQAVVRLAILDPHLNRQRLVGAWSLELRRSQIVVRIIYG